MLFLYNILNFRRILYVSYLKIHNHTFLATPPERLGAETDNPNKKKCVSRCRCSFSGHDSLETACEVSHFASTNLSEIMKHLQRALDMQVWIFISPLCFSNCFNSDLCFYFSRQKSTRTSNLQGCNNKAELYHSDKHGVQAGRVRSPGVFGEHCFTKLQGPHCRLITQGARSVVRYLL